jgi:CheY-like chemotaxis protein
VTHALIVDDEPNNLAVLGELLSMEGVDYTEVVNPPDAETVLSCADQIDVIFLDIKMPGVSGYDILNTLKSDARFQSVPVVAYSVHTNEVHQARARGFDSFLSKPLDIEQFPEQIARILRGEKVWAF